MKRTYFCLWMGHHHLINSIKPTQTFGSEASVAAFVSSPPALIATLRMQLIKRIILSFYLHHHPPHDVLFPSFLFPPIASIFSEDGNDSSPSPPLFVDPLASFHFHLVMEWMMILGPHNHYPRNIMKPPIPSFILVKHTYTCMLLLLSAVGRAAPSKHINYILWQHIEGNYRKISGEVCQHLPQAVTFYTNSP